EKSAAEIAFMRKAARISDKIMSLALENARPGLRKNKLIGDIVQAAYHGVGDAWGDYPAIAPLAPSGADAAAPHLTWNGDALRAGEGTFFELAGCYRRYHAPLCRTVFLGRPPPKMRDAAAALVAGLAAGIEVARAGAVAGDVARAMEAELTKAGIHRAGRCGYPIGLSYPPDWGERTFSIRPSDDTELKAGMTFHFMPGLWMDDWGMEITETLLIKPTGPAEALGQVDRKLFVKN
ncbi:MAG: M24 family metallopeptidase, partial [Thalassobaculaceae bacterium]